jgi:hypothetical protein
MAVEDIFERSLERSTPGFDSLLGAIQTETQRIEQNRQFARERQMQLDAMEKKSDLALERQVELQNIRQQDSIQLAELENELAKDQLEFKTNLQQEIAEEEFEREQKQQKQEDLENYFENLDEARKDARTQEGKLRRNYDSVFMEGLLPEPRVKPKPVGDTGIFTNAVYTKDGNEIGTVSDYEDIANDLTNVAKFARKLQNTSALIETEDGTNVKKGDTEFVTRENASDMLQNIQGMSIQELEQFSNSLREGRYATADRGMFSKEELGIETDSEESEQRQGSVSAVANDMRSVYMDLKSESVSFQTEDGGDKVIEGAVMLPQEFVAVNRQYEPVYKLLDEHNMSEIKQLNNDMIDYMINNSILTEDASELTKDISKFSKERKQLIEAQQATSKAIKGFNKFKESDSYFPSTTESDYVWSSGWDANIQTEEDMYKAFELNKNQEQKPEEHDPTRGLFPNF